MQEVVRSVARLMPKFNRPTGILVVPVISGTSFVPIESAITVSSFPYSVLPLPLLSMEAVETVVEYGLRFLSRQQTSNSTVSFTDLLLRWRTFPGFRLALLHVGGNPRMVEIIFRELAKGFFFVLHESEYRSLSLYLAR